MAKYNPDFIDVCAISLVEGNKNDFLYKEFESLVETCEMNIRMAIHIKLKEVNRVSFFGKGKLEEIAFKIKESIENVPELSRISKIVCNFDLTALQKRRIEEVIGVEVIDRSRIILRIFELNARSKEAIKQIEIAKLEYLRSNLIDNKANYSQVTSGSGHNKGRGEKQIELSRRQINSLITKKQAELKELTLARRNNRKNRLNNDILKISIVGYTNAGKSTLMNALLDYSHHKENKKVLEEDKLFATLETSTRMIETNRFPSFLITDTVGFISNLPISLIKAFRSTLEEIKEADLIIHVVDLSSPFKEENIRITNEVLKELEVDNLPMVYLLNKYDLLTEYPNCLPKDDELYVSLKKDLNVEEILDFVFSYINKDRKLEKVLFPYDKNFNQFLKDNYVVSYKEKEDGYECEVYLNPLTLYKYSFIK